MPVSQETSVCLLALSSPHVIVSNMVAPLGLENCSGLAYVALALSPYRVSSLGTQSGP